MAVLVGLVTVLDGPKFQSRRQLRGALGFETRALGPAGLGKQHPSWLVKIRCPPLRYGMTGWSFLGEKQRGWFWLALVMQEKPENETPITLYDEDSTN